MNYNTNEITGSNKAYAEALDRTMMVMMTMTMTMMMISTIMEELHVHITNATMTALHAYRLRFSAAPVCESSCVTERQQHNICNFITKCPF